MSEQSLISTDDTAFRQRVYEWIDNGGEVFAVIHYAGGGGARDFALFATNGAFKSCLQELPAAASIGVVRDYSLPLRGRVDDDFVKRAISMITPGDEWLILRVDPVTIGAATWQHHQICETAAELKEELRDSYCYGQFVIAGPCPRWWEPSPAVVSAIAPNPDGSVTPGAY